MMSGGYFLRFPLNNVHRDQKLVRENTSRNSKNLACRGIYLTLTPVVPSCPVIHPTFTHTYTQLLTLFSFSSVLTLTLNPSTGPGLQHLTLTQP